MFNISNVGGKERIHIETWCLNILPLQALQIVLRYWLSDKFVRWFIGQTQFYVMCIYLDQWICITLYIIWTFHECRNIFMRFNELPNQYMRVQSNCLATLTSACYYIIGFNIIFSCKGTLANKLEASESPQ